MATTYVFNKHDLGITNVGTDGSGTDIIGLMLAKDPKTQVSLYQMLDARMLVDQFMTSVPSPDYTDPEQELILAQSDWRSGFGQEYYDAGDPKRYFRSLGADLRYKDMAVLGPAVTALTQSTLPTVTDGGMEIWTDPTTLTNWTYSKTFANNNLTQGTAGNKYAGTYSAAVMATRNGAASTSSQIIQELAGWAAAFQGKLISVTVYCKTTAANTGSTASLIIDDGVGTTTKSTISLGAFAQFTCTRQLDAAATKLQITLKVESGTDGGDFTAYFDQMEIATYGVNTAMCEFNDDLYFAAGKVLYKLNTDGATTLLVAIMPATITALEPFVDSRLYVALGLSNAYWYCDTSEAFTESNAVVNTFQFFKTVHSAAPVLWGNDGVNTIRSNTNPINAGAAWSAQTTVSSTYNSITSLFTKGGALYIAKEDMPYYLNSAGAVQNDLAPEVVSLTNAKSGKNALVWQDNVYYHCGVNGLLEIGTTNTWRSPSLMSQNDGYYSGQLEALAADENYIYAVLDYSSGGTDYAMILAGHLETIESNTDWVWHPIQWFSWGASTRTGETAFVSSVYQKRLWLTSNIALAPKYIPLPSSYGNITGDTNRSFLSGGYFETPYLHGGFLNNKKAYIKIIITNGHAYDADIYWKAEYSPVSSSTWTTIGNLKGTATDRTASAFIPADASSVNPVYPMMKFRFTGYTDDVQKTPVLLNYTIKAILYPDVRNIIFCTVRAANELPNKDGLMERFEQATIETTITNARNATWPVSIRDIDGATQTVKFLPLPRNIPRYVLVKDEAGRGWEKHYNLLLQIVPLS